MAKKEKTYQDKLMDQAKGHISLGVITGIGAYGFSRVGAAHPETRPVSNAVVGGLQLTNVGKFAETGMVVAGADKKKKSKSNDIVNKFWQVINMEENIVEKTTSHTLHTKKYAKDGKDIVKNML